MSLLLNKNIVIIGGTTGMGLSAAKAFVLEVPNAGARYCQRLTSQSLLKGIAKAWIMYEECMKTGEVRFIHLSQKSSL